MKTTFFFILIGGIVFILVACTTPIPKDEGPRIGDLPAMSNDILRFEIFDSETIIESSITFHNTEKSEDQ